MCYEIRNKERLEKNELIRQNKLKREHKQCPVCGKKFEVNKSHLVYCSAECREVATKDKKKKYFKNYYSENRDKIIENNSINQKKKAGKIQICLFLFKKLETPHESICGGSVITYVVLGLVSRLIFKQVI